MESLKILQQSLFMKMKTNLKTNQKLCNIIIKKNFLFILSLQIAVTILLSTLGKQILLFYMGRGGNFYFIKRLPLFFDKWHTFDGWKIIMTSFNLNAGVYLDKKHTLTQT